jgi:predicted aconitase
MRLNDEERAMLAGAFGPLRQWALDHQVKGGRYLGAADLVAVGQAHIMGDTESLGEAGVAWLEHWARLPRGTDFDAAGRLRQQEWMVHRERRASDAFTALGVPRARFPLSETRRSDSTRSNSRPPG